MQEVVWFWRIRGSGQAFIASGAGVNPEQPLIGVTFRSSGVLGMAALINKVLRSLMPGPDLDELRRIRVSLAKMLAQAALAIVNLHHS